MATEDDVRRFHVVDYVVFVLMFVASISIGVYHAFRSRHKATTDEYLMGGRRLGLLPVSISICVSVISANTLLGAPAEMYTYGIMYEIVAVPIFLSTVIVALWFVPLLYPLRLTSAHKYLYLRFNSKGVQYMGTFLLLLTQFLYVGCVIFGPATALEIATGIPPWGSIILVSVIGTAYTSFGGMKAVIWTDVFQSSIMVAGMLAIIIQGSLTLGGFANIWKINKEYGRLDINTSSSLTERFTLLSLIIGFTIYWVGSYGVNQPCTQRYCAMESQKLARLSMLLNGPGFIMFTTLSVMAGMVAFAYYQVKGCDPLASGQIANGNQLTPYFVMEILGYPGIPGIFVSSIFSGSLSTLSSSVNSMAAVVWEDVLSDRYSHLAESQKTWISRGLSVFFGLICMGVSFLVLTIGGNLVQMATSFFGLTIGPLLGVFVLGGLIPWANALGTIIGACVGLGVNFWLLMGQTLMKTQRKRLPTTIANCVIQGPLNGTDVTSTFTSLTDSVTTTAASGVTQPIVELSGLHFLYSISFNWYAVIGFLLTVIVGMVISLPACQKKYDVEKRYFFPCLRRYVGKPNKVGGKKVQSADVWQPELKIVDVTSI